MAAKTKTNTGLRRSITNLLYAFAAQGISLVLSILMSLLVPKTLVDPAIFGYWQLFLFYSSYVGFFHFGLIDGIYLRFGGTEYRDLDFSMLGSQFWTCVISQTFIAAVIAIIGISYVEDPSRRFVLFATAVSLIVINAAQYLGIVFQMANLTKLYSISVIIDKSFFLGAVVVLLLFRGKHFEPFIICYLITRLISLVYCIIKGRNIVFAKLQRFRYVISEMVLNISVGVHLMFSNIAGMLIIGMGRLVVERTWGVSAFGKVSFSITLTNFFLLFIGQVGMVLFPALRQVSEVHLKNIYQHGRVGMGVLLAAVFLAYLPIQFLLGKWLPQYAESLRYLALMLPMCTFDGKMQMLCNTYMKVLRKERILLAINLGTFIFSAILSLFSGYILHSIYAIIVSMVVSIALRNVVTEIYLSQLLQVKVFKNILTESSLALIFVLCTWFLGSLQSFMIYSVAYAVYLILIRNDISGLIQFAKSSKKSA